MWEEIDRDFLVIERHDRGSETGVRDVSFALATVDLPGIDVPEFAKYVIEQDDPLGEVLSSLGVPDGAGLPGYGGARNPTCCDETGTTVTDVEPPDSYAGIAAVPRTRGVTIGPNNEIWGAWAVDFVDIEPLEGDLLGIIAVQTNNGFVPTIESSLPWTQRYSATFGDVTLSIFTAPIPDGFGYGTIALGAGVPGSWTNYLFDTVAGGSDVVQTASETASAVNALVETLAAARASGNVAYAVLGRSNVLDSASHPAATDAELEVVGTYVVSFQTAVPLEVMMLDSSSGAAERTDWSWAGSAADAAVVLLEIEVV